MFAVWAFFSGLLITCVTVFSKFDYRRKHFYIDDIDNFKCWQSQQLQY